MNTTKKLMSASLLLALGLILPTFTMQIPNFGSMLLPMHIPVLLCGFLLGWKYGLLVGIMTPLLRSLLFGMPPIYPTAIAMAVELAAYGVSVALLYRFCKHSLLHTYLTLIASMLIGRILWGLVMMVLMNVSHGEFSFAIFLSGAFLNATPGILLQLIIIPPLVNQLQKTGKFS